MKKRRFFTDNWLTVFTAGIIFFIGIMTVICNHQNLVSDLSDSFNSAKAGVRESGLNGIKTGIDMLDRRFNENLFGNRFSVEVLGLFNRMMNKKIIADSEENYKIYKMNNHQLTYNYTGYDTTDYAENYLKFAAALRRSDIPLLYIQAPFKIDKYNNELPYGVMDETNPLADHFLEIISCECDTLDLRELIHQEGFEYSSLFYKTDHHWTAETGLWASAVIADELQKRYDTELDTSHLSRENYIFETYENYMLGSQGKRTGMVYAGLDDFVLIEPGYETEYHIQIPRIKLDREGCYSETLLFMEYMGQDYYRDDPGRVYTGDNYALMIIRNHLSVNDSKVLLVKDSYSKSVIPFFASTCKELHVIDLRVFKDSVAEYAKENGMECVVVMYNPSAVVRPELFDFK